MYSSVSISMLLNRSKILPWVLLLSMLSAVVAQTGKCDQTPPQATILAPSENKDMFHLSIENAKRIDEKIFYTPDQTYILTLKTMNSTRPFRGFMITAEDPKVDNRTLDFGPKLTGVGSLKTVDTDRQSRYSERCFSSVENADNAEKLGIEIHWVSPKQVDTEQTVRIRAMVAENNEVWYTGENLTITLYKDNKKPRDHPPYPPRANCNICSEARYEVIFNGKWSRVAHPRHYPSKPDENGYSHMIGASHAFNYTLWQQGALATPGLKELAEKADSTFIEREIINEMNEKTGTRTLIRGKRRHHPYMFEPSHSLFRVDPYHHLFSIAVALRPSPDWFLGTSKFELCTDDGWLEQYEIPLYPWDAGTMDGVSYESPKSTSEPKNNVQRVEVGSFNRESPFYQMNLNDLPPFAMLEIRRLDVYPYDSTDCSEEEDESNAVQTRGRTEEEETEDEPKDEPIVAELRQNHGDQDCKLAEWGEWSSCVPYERCGDGVKTRIRYIGDESKYYDTYAVQEDLKTELRSSGCRTSKDYKLMDYQPCSVECY